jgi:signal transduction histidine kinase
MAADVPGEARQADAWLELALRIARMIAWQVDFRTQAAQVTGDLGGLLGRSPDEPLDTLDAGLALVFADDLPIVLAMLQRAATGEITAEVQFRILHRTNGPTWFEGRTESVRDADGKVIGARGVLVDVDERKRTEARLMVADRMASVGLLAAGVAHEINNPLAAVLANLTLAEQRFSEPYGDVAETGELDVRALVRDAIAAADHVRKIVRDLATLSRDGGGEIGPIDLHAVIEASVRMAWNEIRHRARLERSFGEVPVVRADESRLGQVFLNLLINAAQAIPEGHADEHVIRIVTRFTGGEVVVEISDTGAGMTAEVQRRLFTPFYTTKPPGSGTGLGLSICQRIISEMGGRIDVRSSPGAGATFTVRMPVVATARTITPRAATPKPVRRCRVLVVEDEPAVGIAVRRLLLGSHDVEVVAGGRVALQRVRDGEKFDVILSDLLMPEMSGMELHEELERTHPALAARMIFVSGGAFTPRARRFLERYADRRLDKPFDLPKLLAMITAVAG